MHVMFSSRHQKFTCVYDVITIFYQQEHRSSFFLILPLPPLIFPFFFATLTKPAEANPSCRVAPNGFDPVSLSLSLFLSLPNFGGFSYRRRRRRRRGRGRGRSRTKDHYPAQVQSYRPATPRSRSAARAI